VRGGALDAGFVPFFKWL